MGKLKLIILPIAFAVMVVLLYGCSTMEKTTSHWKTDEIKIDGNDDDWKGDLAYYEDQNVMIGIKNNSNYLYLCFKTDDGANIRKIMGNGMTIWLNNNGGLSKAFGIHYPLGGSVMLSGNPENQQPDKRDFDTVNFRERLKNQMLAYIEIQTSGNEKQKLSVEGAKADFRIAPAIKIENGILTYEIAIPFKTNIGYNELNLKPVNGNAIGLGFETGESKTGDRSRTYSREEPPDGGGQSPGEGVEPPIGGGGYPGDGGMYPRGGGGFGGGRRRGGGSYGGNRQNVKEPLSLWINVQLANETSGSH